MDLENIIWPKTAEDAVIVQNELRGKIRIENDFPEIKIIAGVDVSYDITSNLTRAFIVLLDYQSLQMIASVKAVQPTDFPYIPGFLSFREIPTILEAMKLLPQKPDLLMIDGQGIAHPRHMGIAAHLGVLTNMPTIGVAKKKLTGFFQDPGMEKGNHTPLLEYKTRTQIGTVLRSKDKIKPLFISPGHRVDQETALEITMHCLTKYKLPEPTRIADKLSKEKETEMLF